MAEFLELEKLIQENNLAYRSFLTTWYNYGNNTGTGYQFAQHYSGLKPLQDKTTTLANNLSTKYPFHRALGKTSSDLS